MSRPLAARFGANFEPADKSRIVARNERAGEMIPDRLPTLQQVALPPSPPEEPGRSPPPHKAYLSPVIPPLTPERTPATSMTLGAALESMQEYSVANQEDAGQASAGAAVPGRSPRVPSGATSVASEQQKRVELRDFELIRVLGKGCAGRVLLVRHTATARVLAMKAISKRSVLANNELHHTLAELSILQRFAEVEPQNRFVSRLHYAFTDRENFYFTMRFYPGGDLATQLEIHGSLGFERTRFYATDLVQGIEDLHRHGVMIRDLKPENVLLDHRGHAVLADFGLAKEFAYRGEPQAVHVGWYTDTGKPPSWAGMGLGSLRTGDYGKQRVEIDRATSFVGTSEYIAPEVLKGGGYSYPVDWWALGCILFEGIVGRVPFKLGADEDPTELWSLILHGEWDDCLHSPYYDGVGLDRVTWDLLDALLQKDPMHRLTEPCIKKHPYFDAVDWDLVRSGSYTDPHGLQLYRTAELNVRYFPKLCLSEEPSIDMRTHEAMRDAEEDQVAGSPDRGELTPLNDTLTFMDEQHRFRRELRRFYWVNPAIEQGQWEGDSSDGHHSETAEEREEGMPFEEEELRRLERQGEDLAGYNVRDYEMPDSSSMASDDTHSTLSTGEYSGEGEELSRQRRPSTPLSVSENRAILASEGTGDNSESQGVSAASLALAPVESIPGSMDAGETPRPGSVARTERSIRALQTSTSSRPHSPISDAASPTPITSSPRRSMVSPLPISSPGSRVLEKPPSSPQARGESTRVPARPISILTPPQSPTSPIVPVSKPLNDQDPRALSPKPIPRPVTGQDAPIRPPLGFPSSGLSVSDVVSVSANNEIPRLIRRHPHLASLETLPVSRLSVELHGTVTQLGEDEWEAVVVDSTADLPSAPNGAPTTLSPSGSNSFLNRLRRRPSTIMTSGLRWQGQGQEHGQMRGASDSHATVRSKMSDSSREQSPTKTSSGGGIGGGRVLEGTKRALSHFKAFPRMRLRRSGASDAPSSPARSGKGVVLFEQHVQPSSHHSREQQGKEKEGGLGDALREKTVSAATTTSPARPGGPVRRHTESGWFDRRRKKRASANAGARGATASGNGDGDVFGTTAGAQDGGERQESISASASMLVEMERSASDPIATAVVPKADLDGGGIKELVHDEAVEVGETARVGRKEEDTMGEKAATGGGDEVADLAALGSGGSAPVPDTKIEASADAPAEPNDLHEHEMSGLMRDYGRYVEGMGVSDVVETASAREQRAA